MQLHSVQVPDFNLVDYRSKTHEARELASYISELN